jgi:hypothetical protein
LKSKTNIDSPFLFVLAFALSVVSPSVRMAGNWFDPARFTRKEFQTTHGVLSSEETNRTATKMIGRVLSVLFCCHNNDHVIDVESALFASAQAESVRVWGIHVSHDTNWQQADERESE